jgi:urease accessory protein
MPRVTRIVPAAEKRADAPIDTLILPHAQRQAHKGFVFGVKGTCVEFDFEEPVRLRTDDVLVLDDGRTVEVVAEPEALLEVRSADVAVLARLAWRLGDRHVPVQVLERKLRFRRDDSVEAVLDGWGIKAVPIDAPFEPEGGAYAAPADDHHHDHDHDHGHHDHRRHHDRHHSHDHGQDHDHAHGHDDHHDHHHHDHGHKHD